MSFNYVTNSSGFTRITAYVGQLLDGAVDGHIEELSQKVRPDPATRGLNRPYDLGELNVPDNRPLMAEPSPVPGN